MFIAGRYSFNGGEVHSQCGQDHSRISLIPMTHVEMDAIKIENPPVCLQRALPPGLKLLLEILIEAADGAGARRQAHSGFGDLP